MRKIFVKVLMSQGNLEEIKAFESEPFVTQEQEADDDWSNGSKVFEVDLDEEKTWDVVVTQKNVFQVKAVDETEARRQAEIAIWDETLGDYDFKIDVKEKT
tara:strand:+ start:7494 stop:7796 length:303 start_codon:yes stop_codon:yes gene_type:complete